jgi:hypothetical protein
MGRWAALLVILCASAWSCAPPRPPLSIQHEDVNIKILAIQKAAREKDRSAIPNLVRELENDDPAVRFYAIQALEDLTGQTFGFDYYKDEAVRKPAVLKWQEWLKTVNSTSP